MYLRSSFQSVKEHAPKRSMTDLCTVWMTHVLNVNSVHIISTLKERHSTALEFVKLQQVALYVQTLLTGTRLLY